VSAARERLLELCREARSRAPLGAEAARQPPRHWAETERDEEDERDDQEPEGSRG
jgi:hypothetical protein